MYCHNCPGILTDTGLVIIAHLCLLTQVLLSSYSYTYRHRPCHHCLTIRFKTDLVIVQLYVLTQVLSPLSSYTDTDFIIIVQLCLLRSCHQCLSILTDTGIVIIVQPYLLTQVLSSLSSIMPGGQEQVKPPSVFLHMCEHVRIPELHSSMSVTIQTYVSVVI